MLCMLIVCAMVLSYSAVAAGGRRTDATAGYPGAVSGKTLPLPIRGSAVGKGARPSQPLSGDYSWAGSHWPAGMNASLFAGHSLDNRTSGRYGAFTPSVLSGSNFASLPLAYRHMLANISSLIASGALNPQDVYLPNFYAASSSQRVGVSPLYSGTPAPMGIADYGLNKSGNYTYYTSSFDGTVDLNSYSTFSPSPLGQFFPTSPSSSGIQFNTVLSNVTVGNNISGVYWIQNVALVNGTSLTFIDNIWNFSAPGASMHPSTIYSGNGSTSFSNFYSYVGPTVQVSYPLRLSFYNNATVYKNRPAVFFNYSYSTPAGAAFHGSYDTVLFNSAIPPVTPAFEVNGSSRNPLGLLYDAELTFGGPGSGSNAMIQNLSGQASIQYMKGGAYRTIDAAYSYGSDTAETSAGISATWTGQTEYLNQGPSNLSGLWNTASPEHPGYISIHARITPSFAFAFIATGSGLNFAPVSGGMLNATVAPGTYHFVLMANNFTQFSSTFSSNTTASYSMVSSPHLLYAPIYIDGNLQGRSVTSNVSAPDNISNISIRLNSTFMTANDFGYPCFVLLAVKGMTDRLVVRNLNESNMHYYVYGVKYTAKGFNQQYGLYFSSNSEFEYLNLGARQSIQVYGSSHSSFNHIHVNDAVGVMAAYSSSIAVSNIYGTNSSGAAFFHTKDSSASNISLTGNYSMGAVAFLSNYSSISNVSVSSGNYTYGAVAFLSSYSSISNVSISGNYSYGVLELGSNYSSISHVSANNGSYGVLSFISKDGAISGVAASNSSYGVVEMGGNYTTISAVSAQNNSTAVLLLGIYGVTVNGITADNYSNALSFFHVSGGSMTNVGGRFTSPGYVPPASPNSLSRLLVYGVGNNNTLSNIHEAGYAEGIFIGGNNSTISAVHAVNSTYGVWVTGGYGDSVSNSNISSSTYGVLLGQNSSHDTVNGVSTFNDTLGVTVTGSDNYVVSNNISHDASYGVNISAGSGNYVYGNNFIYNNGSTGTYSSSHIQAYSVAGNFFNLGFEGNYWADWHSIYSNGTLKPYNISNGVVDWHPLGSIATHYTVTFTETGLPSGTSWSVTLGGASKSSTSTSITFSEPNGSYAYTVKAVSGYTVSPSSGSFKVDGAGLSKSAAFTPVTYTVTFTESGLPSGTSWSVTLNGASKSSTTSTISFTEPNGTYAFTATNTTDYYATPYSGSTTVSGSNASESITFAHYAYITGTVSPSGATITVNGAAVTVNGGSFNISVTAGSYALKATSAGYNTYYANFTLTAGQAKTLSISMHEQTSKPTHPSSVPTDVYIGIGIAAVVMVVLAAAFVVMRRKR